MEPTDQARAQTQGDRSTSFVLPPAPSSPDPPENPARRSPCQSRFERLRDVYENLSCTNDDTDAAADAIALNDLNASQPAPAGPCTHETTTSTNAKNSSETTRTTTSIRTRIGRLFAQAQPSTHPTWRLRLLPNISIPRLSFLRRDRGASSSMSMPNTRIVYSSDGRAVFEYDPYTVRGTTPPLTGPFDFSLTSQESRFWCPGQGQQRRLRAGSEGSQWRTQRSLNPGVGPARNDGGLSSYGYERAYGRGYAYGQGQRRGEWGTAAAAAAQRERENANTSSRPRGGSGSGSVQIQAPPRIHGPAPRRRRADSTMTTAMIGEESEQPHASSSYVPNRSRSLIPSPSSSVYSDGSGGSVNDTSSSIGCPCCSRRNADEEADKADRANNDDSAGGLMVLDGPADDDPVLWPLESRPKPGRTDSYASSLALLRWEASQPGSPYPSPFRPGLATLTLKRQRERREAKQREQQAAAEEERKTRRRSVSASAALMSAAAEEDDDGAYAAALASLDNPRSASASAVLMDGDDADDDGVYAAALANMPVPMFVPPETDDIVVGAIEALREECEGEAMRQRSRRRRVLAKLKQDVQNMKPRARGGADMGADKKLFRRTW